MASKTQELTIKIAGKLESSFHSAMKAVNSGLKGAGKAAVAGAKLMGKATVAAAGGVAAMGTAAVKTGMDFEKAMSQVQATMLLDTGTAEGAAAMEKLENAARECGRTTAFSATEASEALNYLALAGYDADKAATALPTVLKLAGAGAMDLAAASDMVTDSMSALGIEATQENLTQFSDQLAQTASKANTSVSQLGAAILTVGGTANYLSGGTTELNTALGLLADNGLKGAEGGTKLRNIIMSLSAPTDNAQKALTSLGVSVFDSEGKMRSMESIFSDLGNAMAGMGTDQQASYLSTIFNKTDLAAANALMGTTVQRWDELTDAVKNSAGACENMYSIQLDNLNGDISILKSGLSDLGISIYEDTQGPLRGVVQLGSDMIEQLSAAYGAGGLSGMVSQVGSCLSQVVDVLASAVPGIVDMGVSLIENFVGGITANAGKIAAAGAQALVRFAQGILGMLPNIQQAAIDIILTLVRTITSQLPQLIASGIEALNSLVNGIVEALPNIQQAAIDIIPTLVRTITSQLPQLIASGIEALNSLVNGIMEALPSLIQAATQAVMAFVQGLSSGLPMLVSTAGTLINGLVGGLVQSLPQLIASGIEALNSLVSGIMEALPSLIQAAIEIIGYLVSGLIAAIPNLIAAVPQILMGFIDAIVNTDWIDVGLKIITGIINGFKNAGKSLWKAIKAIFTGGEVELPEAEAAGAKAASSYATGIQNNATAAQAATSSLTAGAFASIDTSAATAAGASSAAAYTASLTAGASTMQAAGASGAAAVGAGITASTPNVSQAADTMAKGINTSLSGGWDEAKEKASTALEEIKKIAAEKAKEAATAVSNAFNGISITIPTPSGLQKAVQTTASAKSGGKSKGKSSVKWNASGGIFDKAAVIGTSQGLQGAGEKGPEALLPLDTLWGKMQEILTGAVKTATAGGIGIVDGLASRLSSLAPSGNTGGEVQLAGAGGGAINYAPVYNIYGSASKDDIVEADRMSQAEFNKMMKQWERGNKRTKF